MVREIASRTGVELTPSAVFESLTPSLLASEINDQPTFRDRSLANSFRTFVREHGHRIALTATNTDEALTYRELDDRSDRFAAVLQANGVLPGDVVALLMNRSHRCIIAILGCLKSGAAYTFIEPTNPGSRTAQMLEDLADSLLVTDVDDQQLADLGVAGIDRRLAWTDPTTWPSAREYTPVKTPADSPAYLIYTSGTTGRPKGVVVSNANALAWLDGKRSFYGTSESDVIASTASFAFDISVTEMGSRLPAAQKLVVIDADRVYSPRALIESYRSFGVTVIMQTPAVFRGILDMGGRDGDPLADIELTCVTVGGEAINESNQRRFSRWWSSRIVRPHFYNLYGPTETTMTVCGSTIPTQTPGSIGSAVGHVTFHVLDDELRPVEPGVEGELYISGPQIAQGTSVAPL